MTLPQSSTRCIVHHQDRHSLLDEKIEHTYNMRVDQTNEGLGLGLEALCLLLRERNLQDFECGITLKITMFAQVDFGKPSLSQQLEETIIPQLQPNTIGSHPV